MDTIALTIPSNIPHCSQIVTGFLRLKEQGQALEITDISTDAANPFYDLPVVLARYRGCRIVYDLWDGYQNPEGIQAGLDACDIYFKRSFSAEKNAALFPADADKMYPLGFNYHVTHRENPIREPLWKSTLKPLLGRTPDRCFVTEVFEGEASRPVGQSPRILFLTRLWDDHDPAMSPELNQERTFINETRMEIIRTMRSRYGDDFIGGLNNCALSRRLAPELIVPAKNTERRNYLKLLHSSDICIGSMGLHESIGWKTGEYVAAAKAIVNETFHYSVPGNFAEGKNYLAFSTASECIHAVQKLVESPEALFAMKQANADYYRNYLKPEVLVKNSLAIVDRTLSRAREEQRGNLPSSDLGSGTAFPGE